MIKQEGSFPWASTALPARLYNNIKLKADAVMGQWSAQPHQFSAPSSFIVKCFPVFFCQFHFWKTAFTVSQFLQENIVVPLVQTRRSLISL